MKKTLPLVVVLMLISALTIAQESNNAWTLGIGVNAVDVYPVNEDLPQGDYFDEFVNVNDHWNMGLYVDVSRSFTERLSLNVRGSYNQISKWGDNANNESIAVANLDYIGLDGMVNFSILKNTVIKPFIAVGGGYTWIEEGPFNTSTANESDDLIGAGTINGALGLNIALSKNVDVKVQTTYKHSFEDYLTKHFQHSVGLAYTFPTAQQKKDKLDDDNDGVSNENDLCPQVAGLPEYAGCADTDGDGTPDSLDKCPDLKGTDNGCPSPDVVSKSVAETAQANLESAEQVIASLKSEMVKEINASVYFDVESSKLTFNAKQVLDLVVNSFKNKTNLIIELSGFADSTGSETFNKKISQERVNNVKEYFISKGINESAITANNYGESNPVAPNNTKEGRALNRRASLKVTLE
jgi:OOP family OmpA-OmpF porin